jgi:membrane-bound metal-dependent hydrolase YbcI (DUF457 family)
MDIATHAAIGMITASPFVTTRPGLAAGLMLGSVLPDLDVLGRFLGKRASLVLHQSWTHSLPVIALLSASVWMAGFGTQMLAGGLAFGLGAGMIAHSLMDFTTSQGVALFAPFTRRRFCLEWNFLIDGPMMLFSALMLAVVFWNWNQPNSQPYAPLVGLLLFIAIYFSFKAWLRRRAGRQAPFKTVSLVPGTWVPWHFIGVRQRQHSELEAFRLNAVSAEVTVCGRCFVHDLEYERFISRLPEFREMRRLSPAYHIVEAGRRDKTTVLYCRDLRARKSRARFGDLKVWLDDSRKIKRIEFHV